MQPDGVPSLSTRPAAIGAIIGSAVPLALALTEAWQIAVLAAGAVLLLALRLGVVWTLLLAGATGMAIGVAGGPLPIQPSGRLARNV